MSQLKVKTLRQDPADAVVPSHRWLVRGGYIRRVAPGVYSWLPLGLKVLAKLEAIARQEMDQIGAQEVRFPALLPREPYEATGRWDEYGPNLFRLRDRTGADYLLGPTHEEMFTLLVKDLYSSYKDLPLILYQIQTKYRDEARPRAGILRGREFVMKDSYSFDLDEAGLGAAYEAHRQAYSRVCRRLGLEHVIVQAQSGAMGGSRSEEFLVLSPHGEDSFVRSPGGYAANVEAVRTPVPPPGQTAGLPQPEAIMTPGAGTIDALVTTVNRLRPDQPPQTAADTLKNVVLMLTHPDGRREPLIIGLPGDREIDPRRLEAALHPDWATPFEEADFAAWPALVKGYIGPVRLTPEGLTAVLGTAGQSRVRYLLDPRVVPGTVWTSGANVLDQHLVNLVCGRDFTADGVIDVAEVRDGDPAPDGSGPLQLARGVELGHIFQLGRKYAEALGLKVLDQQGQLRTVTMGSYGLGLSRALALVAESHCDQRGLVWPRAVAPYDVILVSAGRGQEIAAAAESLAAELSALGLEVVWDDREVSPGVKFADAELLGFPTIVIVGRGLAQGLVEVRDRASGQRWEVALADAAAQVVRLARDEVVD
ncbi:MAG: proline--tRNA ligase [Propionibacteriaceae bacterium]|nr:proline--tRNA ligase [Propionibacteriaceae bacterium]